MATGSDKYHHVIGIDLGTTYSAVAAYDKYMEQSVIISNREIADGQTTPSVISYDPIARGVIVGIAAKRNLASNPDNTVIEVKREMGEMFSPATLQKYRAENVYRAKLDGQEGDPVHMLLNGEWYLPQEISAFTLMKMKQVAEAEFGTAINDAVITVPAYFTARQKKATEEAALLAGLYPRQLVPEPTAAAICYGVDRYEPDRKIYLVYDLGGGTFDVSIISVEESRIDVIATSGDPRLGGGDFDDAITQWAVNKLRTECNLEISNDRRAQTIVKYHAETLKKNLSTFEEERMTLMELRPHDPPTVAMTRMEFEGLIDHLLDKSLNYVDIALRAAQEKKGIRRDDITAILLVGGSSKIPRVKAKLLDYFNKDEEFVRSDLDADAVVARGAAMLALQFAPTPGAFDIARQDEARLTNLDIEEELHVSLITEHSLGIGVQGDRMDKLVDQGTSIPVSVTKGNYTNSGPGTDIEVRVYQGEGTYTYENTLIGILHLGPMEPKPEGFHRFEITFDLDLNGILSITVHHLNENKSYQDRFEQPTGIGGADALSIRRDKLRAMMASHDGTVQTGGPAHAMPQPASTPAPTAHPGPVAAAPDEPAPVAEVVAAPAAQGDAETIAPTQEIPDQFKSLVRRAQKLLLKKSTPELLQAFNAFVTALDAGQPEDALLDLADELEDVYHDARN